ncbi:predicted protein [Postia placenta Mad-698-R]|uniref:Uncharacterized protein n=1 Tax=Postia placenta MAD-698-R-SB12 TaxID=670580 RepID=A0A1X6NDV4_9APHY|nr:hypothetical protein POSPLADRAFT_1175517 [Postia placenta MAD-698-R-SB12]EED80320.1 predicted protein [Postia placenta Mad-698-R]OSX66827.1 hypothetical protein POSPLADRAFT_1175517 [Postia placenta MAD-698-R-SB12]
MLPPRRSRVHKNTPVPVSAPRPLAVQIRFHTDPQLSSRPCVNAIGGSSTSRKATSSAPALLRGQQQDPVPLASNLAVDLALTYVLEISTSPWPERVMCAKRYLYNSDLSQLAMTSRAAGPSGQIRGPMDSVVYLAFDLQVPNVEEWITGHRATLLGSAQLYSWVALLKFCERQDCSQQNEDEIAGGQGHEINPREGECDCGGNGAEVRTTSDRVWIAGIERPW